MNRHGENTRSIKTGHRYFHEFSLIMKEATGGNLYNRQQLLKGGADE